MKFILIAAFALLTMVQVAQAQVQVWLSYYSRTSTTTSAGTYYERWTYTLSDPGGTPDYTHRIRVTDSQGNVTRDDTDHNSFSVPYGRNYDWSVTNGGITVAEQATTYWTVDNPFSVTMTPRLYLTANHVSSTGQGGSTFYFDKTITVGAHNRATTQFGYAENGNYTSGSVSLNH